MAENTSVENGQQATGTQAGADQSTKTKFTGAGKPEVVNRVSPSGKQNLPQQNSQAAGQQQTSGDNAGGNSANDNAGGDGSEGAGASQSAIDKAQIDAVLKQTFGDEYNGDVEAFKAKLAKPAAPVQETDDEKKAKELATEQRMLDFFIKSESGDIQKFAHLQEIANADLTKLSEVALVNELRESGFSDSEIEALKKERYYQLSDEDIDAEENEDAKNFLKKKKEVFSKRPTAKAQALQNQAKEVLNRVRKAVETQDLVAKQEQEFSSKVDEFVQKLPKEIALELGEVDDTKIDPIQYKYEDSDIQEVAAILKDPKQRNKIIFNDDNTTNLESLAKLLLDNKTMKSALKKVYLESADRQVKVFETRFPYRQAQDLGVRGANQGNKGTAGKFVSSGAPVVVNKQK